MKKLSVLFIAVILFAIGCSKDGSSESCYVFDTKIVTTVSPNLAGYPQTTTTTTEKCGLTPDEAKSFAQSLTSTSHSTASGHSITVTQTCTYHKK